MVRIDVLKHLFNVLAVVLLGAVAFIFIAYGLTYKNFSFIAVHFQMLVWISFAAICTLTFCEIFLYLFNKQALFKLLMCVLIFLDISAVIYYVLCITDIITKITTVEGLRAFISQAGSAAAIIYILFSFLQVVVLPVPGSVTIAVGVAMFGPLICSVYSFIGILSGSIVAYALGRLVGYKAVCWIVGKDAIDKWLKKLKGKDYLILSLMFLLPLFPDDMLCFVAGLSSMTWLYFLVMITVTRAISVFSTAYSFDLIPFNTWWGIIIWIALLAGLIISFYLVFKYSDKIDKFIKSKFKIKGRKNKKVTAE